jgi:hypothetical protein
MQGVIASVNENPLNPDITIRNPRKRSRALSPLAASAEDQSLDGGDTMN